MKRHIDSRGLLKSGADWCGWRLDTSLQHTAIRRVCHASQFHLLVRPSTGFCYLWNHSMVLTRRSSRHSVQVRW